MSTIGFNNQSNQINKVMSEPIKNIHNVTPVDNTFVARPLVIKDQLQSFSPVGKSAPHVDICGSDSPPTKAEAEMDWAIKLQDKVGSGYSPSQVEITKYENIFERYMQTSHPVDSIQPAKPVSQGSTSKAEIDSVTPGYKPGKDKLEKYEAINVVKPSGSASKAEMDWAHKLEESVKNGHPPTSTEKEKYEEIYIKATSK